MLQKRRQAVAVVYDKCDFDGICGYAIIKDYFTKQSFLVVPKPYGHGGEEPDVLSVPASARLTHVVIVDTCLSAESMKKLHRMGEDGDGSLSVTWIDHHLSSIDLSVREGFSGISGVRKTGRQSACELAWEFLHPGTETPLPVSYISAYDVFDKTRPDWESAVLPFQYAMRQRYGLDAEKFAVDFNWLCYDDEYVDQIVSAGRGIYAYARSSGEHGVDAYGFLVTIAGDRKALCCLTNQSGSLAFESRMEREGVDICVCANRTGPDRFRVSAFGIEGRNNLNLGKYMQENYGGGGHFNAAGGTLNTFQFIRLVTDCEL